MQNAPEIPLPFQISRMVTSYWVPQAIHVAATLGVADVLAGGPRQSADIARTVGAHPDALHRLLRALVVLELCTQSDDGAFALTPLGACLRSDTPDSVRSWVLLVAGDMVWQSWGRLIDCVRTGDSVPKQGGVGAFDGIVANPETADVFNQSMVQLTRHLAPAIAVAYDFSGIRTIVDVGGRIGATKAKVYGSSRRFAGAERRTGRAVEDVRAPARVLSQTAVELKSDEGVPLIGRGGRTGDPPGELCRSARPYTPAGGRCR
ncbi:MAG: methyltransferase family protein, partial [Candidatus Binatia bacterium]